MDELAHTDGKILLVGEGDFSFAASLMHKLPSNKYRNIIASSLETEDSINKHQHARSNMDWLEQQGVTVMLSTDATKLHTNPDILPHQYSQVIFNFPHTGGKSNHKKNRKLLNDFFTSAASVLDCQGKILVTLCKGQGGTPSDRPMRKWHDSWQVVSMAANASLILVDIQAFIAEEYGTYTSTGFRSLDKGFHTEDALTHVFEKADQVEVPADGCDVRMMIDNEIFLCSRFTYEKLLQIRQISDNKDHPLCQVYSKLTDRLRLICEDIHVNDCGHSVMLKKISKVITADNQKKHSEEVNHQDYDCPSVIERNFLNDFSIVTAASKTTNQHIEIASNTLDTLANDSSDCVSISYGPVFKACVISQNQSPVEYHMTVCHPIKLKEFNIDEEVTRECIADKKLIQATLEYVKNVVMNVFNHVLQNYKHSVIFYNQAFDNLSTNCSDAKVLSTLFLKQCLLVGSMSDSNHDINGDESLKEIGHVYFKAYSDRDNNGMVYLDMNIQKLTCLVYEINDQRILWSDDHRILQQFGKLDTRSGNLLTNSSDMNQYEDMATSTVRCNLLPDRCSRDDSITVKPVSLYPMVFSHDMSFWENDKVEFCETEFCDVIRDVAGEVVITIELIDKYIEQETDRTSLCYRLTFQSVDKVLSYDTSWKLQSLIRLEVQKRMKIILR